jgi:hypothetical protein
VTAPAAAAGLLASGKHEGDRQLLSLVAAVGVPHDPVPGPRVTGMRKSASGTWHVGYGGSR